MIFCLDNIVKVINCCNDELVRKRVRSIPLSASFASKVTDAYYNPVYCKALRIKYSNLDLPGIHRLMLLTYYKNLEV